MSPVGCKTVVASLATAAMAGCAGSGAGLDSNGQPIGSGGGSTRPLAADFQSIQDNVFTPICTRCHIGAGAPQGLQLDAGHSYALLVGVPSAEEPNRLGVKPGDPNNSYLIHKLEGRNIVGLRMPADGPPYLPQATIDVIRAWITNGALRAAAVGTTASSKAVGGAQPARDTGSAAAFAVTATSPLNDSVVTMPVARIVVAFNHDIDATLVNYTTVTLEKADTTMSSDPIDSADATTPMATMTSSGTPAPQIPISTTSAAGNPAAIVISPRTPLATGTYRVTLRGTGGGALADLNAQALRTDYTFAFTVDASP